MGSESRHWRRGAASAGGVLLATALVVALTGCNPFADPPPCPRVSILKEARLLTLYGDGPGREAPDVAFDLELRNVTSDCDYDLDDSGGGVEVTFALPIRALRGPAAESDRVSVPFFVALTDPSRQIVTKEVFTAEIAFEADSTSARTVEEMEQWIPLGPGEIGARYETLVGFQLTAVQLEESQRPKTQ